MVSLVAGPPKRQKSKATGQMQDKRGGHVGPATLRAPHYRKRVTWNEKKSQRRIKPCRGEKNVRGSGIPIRSQFDETKKKRGKNCFRGSWYGPLTTKKKSNPERGETDTLDSWAAAQKRTVKEGGDFNLRGQLRDVGTK